MIPSKLAAALLLALAAAPAYGQGSPLIGHRARALQERYRNVDGAVVVGSLPISWDVIDGATARWLTLSIAVAAPDSAAGVELTGAPIVDAREIPRIGDTVVLFAACAADGQTDPMVAALVRPSASGRPTVLSAWRPDLLAKRIIDLPAASVVCELIPDE
jgi:hypothetical protein